MTPDRLILIDLLHNSGSTERQITYRIRDFSPHQIRAGLNRLTDAGHIRTRLDCYEITREGFSHLCPEDAA